MRKKQEFFSRLMDTWRWWYLKQAKPRIFFPKSDLPKCVWCDIKTLKYWYFSWILKKNSVSTWKCQNELPSRAWAKGFQCALLHQKQIHLVLYHLEVLQCLMDLVVWSSSFLWTWLGCLCSARWALLQCLHHIDSSHRRDSSSIWTIINCACLKWGFLWYGRTKCHMPGVVHPLRPEFVSLLL